MTMQGALALREAGGRQATSTHGEMRSATMGRVNRHDARHEHVRRQMSHALLRRACFHQSRPPRRLSSFGETCAKHKGRFSLKLVMAPSLHARGNTVPMTLGHVHIGAVSSRKASSGRVLVQVSLPIVCVPSGTIGSYLDAVLH